jgi:hypothetical protein
MFPSAHPSAFGLRDGPHLGASCADLVLHLASCAARARCHRLRRGDVRFVVMEFAKIPSLPGELVVLADELVTRGYREVEERYDPASFGDALLAFKGERARIHFIRDRSQWWILIALPTGDWYPPDIWLAQLDDRIPSTQATTLADDVAAVLERLDDIEMAAATATPSLEESLSELRRRRHEAVTAIPWSERGPLR